MDVLSFLCFNQDSTTQGTDTLEYKMTSFFESLHHSGGCTIPLPFFEREKNCHTTSLPTLDPRMSNVLARISLRNSGLLGIRTHPAGSSVSLSLVGFLEE